MKKKKDNHLSDGFHGGRDQSARSTPNGDELDENRTVGFQHRTLKLALFNFPNTSTAPYREFRNRWGSERPWELEMVPSEAVDRKSGRESCGDGIDLGWGSDCANRREGWPDHHWRWAWEKCVHFLRLVVKSEDWGRIKLRDHNIFLFKKEFYFL